MTIIRPGNEAAINTIVRFSCDMCGCLFEADSSEYKIQRDFRNGRYFSCPCPTCKRTVYSRPEDVMR